MCSVVHPVHGWLCVCNNLSQAGNCKFTLSAFPWFVTVTFTTANEYLYSCKYFKYNLACRLNRNKIRRTTRVTQTGEVFSAQRQSSADKSHHVRHLSNTPDALRNMEQICRSETIINSMIAALYTYQYVQ